MITAKGLVPMAVAVVMAFAAGLMLSRGREPANGHCPAGAKAFQRLELVFGLSRKGGGEVTEEEWQAFVDGEITPRFPDGLTILNGRGQWKSSGGATVKEPARLLLVWVSLAADLETRIEMVRTAWKRRHDQDSVLRAEGASCVSF